MGLGYATLSRQQFVPPEPQMPDESTSSETGPGITVNSPLQSTKPSVARLDRSINRRQSKAASEDNRRTSHYSRSGVHAAARDPNAKEDHNDGEWMYNLDALATEHRTKHRK